MKQLLLSFATTWVVLSASAAQVQILDPCSFQPIWTQSLDLNQPTTVGSLTVASLQQSGLPFNGNEIGIHQIKNSPIGDAALVVLNDRQMRAYGWCYLLNNKYSETFPNQQPVHNSDLVTWFFGYAFYDSGTWTQQCVPAYKAPNLPFCQ